MINFYHSGHLEFKKRKIFVFFILSHLLFIIKNKHIILFQLETTAQLVAILSFKLNPIIIFKFNLFIFNTGHSNFKSNKGLIHS